MVTGNCWPNAVYPEISAMELYDDKASFKIILHFF